MTVKDGLDEQQAAIDTERDELDRLNVAAGLKHLMSAQTGRAWAWKFLGDCGMFQTSVNLSHPNPTAFTFFREGNRNVATKLWGDLQEACIEETALMQREGMERDATRTQSNDGRRKRRRRKKNPNARRDDDVSTE